ncbi:MAG: sortase B protein-sorting domain-containing protein [Bacillota bacterium]|nr:sortase B protein-sorting domain-containing protein [Bacillota bacterium]
MRTQSKHHLLLLGLTFILALGLYLCLTTATVQAANPTSVIVAGQNVIDDDDITYWETDAAGSITPGTIDNWNVKYDPATSPATLTLNGANIKGVATTSGGAGIYANGDLTIDFSGSNMVTGVGKLEGNSYGICVDNNGALTLKGSGSLTVKSVASEGSSYGIYATYTAAIHILGGTINVTADTASLRSMGISVANGDITISDDAKVTATGNNGDFSCGLQALNGGIFITDGEVTAVGNASITPATESSYGLEARSVSIRGGNITAVGGPAADDSYGVRAWPESINITGGAVTATGGDAGNTSYGIHGHAGIWISDATVEATGGKGNNSYGIYAATAIDLYSGKITAQTQAATASETKNAYSRQPTFMPNDNPPSYRWRLAATDGYTASTDKAYTRNESTDKYVEINFGVNPYAITKGANGQWTKGSGKTLPFTANGEYTDKFESVAVDGKLINQDTDYTATTGSTIVTLQPTHLETLAIGEHTLQVNYTDGYAETTFTVLAQPVTPEPGDDPKGNGPKTGDDSNMGLWIALLIAAGTVGTGTALLSRKRKTS